MHHEALFSLILVSMLHPPWTRISFFLQFFSSSGHFPCYINACKPLKPILVHFSLPSPPSWSQGIRGKEQVFSPLRPIKVTPVMNMLEILCFAVTCILWCNVTCVSALLGLKVSLLLGGSFSGSKNLSFAVRPTWCLLASSVCVERFMQRRCTVKQV